ncbi:putative membrane protein [Owenweeksia hongkongensis DSM 17368]|uniref:Putative membrane protein n=1 Tax=Owenweeksia hongkongensis (strain DSM 17368 / CIP 108786 / JCM 12287 / NRRL B-23963 / UST20020801) TaxID=926562 RepID=G8R599_OWEHD|nr:rhomboid family intramembrane serine protease [Owenweeksia hongkongensis]AEV32144.1 putative membrane protein [Owenweeksia hongkongensis DSM 17368]
MSGIREEIRTSFKQGDALTRLILVNLAVFVVFLLLRIIGFLFQIQLADIFTQWTALPSNLGTLATRPWTLFTYMFLHEGFLHILFNMLWLYFGGRLFMEYMGGRRLLSTYILGGLAGGILYIIAYNLFPSFSEAVVISNNRGASAGVMAIVIGVATYAPRYPVKIFFTLNAQLWMIAAAALLMDLIYLGDGNNAGGHIAHLGGALFGYLSVSQLKNGKDWTEGFSKFMDNIANWFKPKPKMKTVYTNTSKKANYREKQVHNQQRMDEILDKISRSGYESLSKEEKDYLFKIGKD